MNFNRNEVKYSNVVSYEGGEVFVKDLTEEWFNCLCSCMVEDRYYEPTEKQVVRYLDLTAKMAKAYGYEFIAKAAVYARNELGMRSISQMTAAWLNDKSFDRKRQFYKNFCHRADDVAEIFAAVDALGQKRSHALVRGCGDYLSSLGAYSIDKYKLNGKAYNMFDCINICHATSPAINAYKNGVLPKCETWEQQISASKSEEEKAYAWCNLLAEGKLGYLALLRNVRNILQTIEFLPKIVKIPCTKVLCDQLCNVEAIKKSLVFPYQIYICYKTLVKSGICDKEITKSLGYAFSVSIDNVPSFDGNTAVLLDVSGSMEDPISKNSAVSIKEAGAVFAVALALKNPGKVDVVKFGTKARLAFGYSPEARCTIGYTCENVFEMIEAFAKNDKCGYGTVIEEGFALLLLLKKSYSRIFIISDMQIMGASKHDCLYNSGLDSYEFYSAKYGKSKVYSFDLGNYHTQVCDPEDKDIVLLTSLGNKVFDFINMKENGCWDIIDYINEKVNYQEETSSSLENFLTAGQ